MTIKTQSSAQSAPPIRAVILDFGEVLCHLPTPEAVAPMARMFQMDSQSFFPKYLESRGPYDRGDLLPAEYWQKFAAQHGVQLDANAIDRIRRIDLDLWSGINESMVRWLERIHAAGFKTAILSNMPLDMVAHVRRNFAWVNHFDHHIFSAEVRSIKPEPAIYQHCLDALAVEPSQALFIDDRDVNLEQARAAGIRTIRFDSVEQLRDDLRALGFPVLPG
ncbi:MAG: HAD family phosphatase [Candidatus Acidiferrales bacterium]